MIRIRVFFEKILRMIGIFFDRLFHKGIADYDLWSLDYTLAKLILPCMIRFRDSERHGYSSYFSEYDKNTYGSREAYEKRISEGHISTLMLDPNSKGFDCWNKAIDEMIFSLEWKVQYDFGDDDDKDLFCKKYDLKNPFAKTEENKSYRFYYDMTEPYRIKQEEETPYVKEFGGLASEVISDESDLHIKEPENYKFKHSDVMYYDVKYENEFITQRAMKGMEAFGKHFFSLWD